MVFVVRDKGAQLSPEEAFRKGEGWMRKPGQALAALFPKHTAGALVRPATNFLRDAANPGR